MEIDSKYIEKIFAPQIKFEGVCELDKFARYFCDLYRIELFKDGLDLILTKIFQFGHHGCQHSPGLHGGPQFVLWFFHQINNFCEGISTLRRRSLQDTVKDPHLSASHRSPWRMHYPLRAWDVAMQAISTSKRASSFRPFIQYFSGQIMLETI